MNVSNQSQQVTCHATSPDQATAVSLSISYGIVLVLAVIGNSLVINFARTNRRMKSNVFNLFLICMATADIVDVLFVAPLHWIFFYYGNIWIGGLFGALTCKLIYFLVEVSIFASVLTLVAITLDRYFAICHIDYNALSRAKTRVIIVGIWTGSCLLSSLQLYKFKIVDFNGQSYCVSTWNTQDRAQEQIIVKYEMTLKFAVSYGIPLLLMIVLYALIIRELRKRLHTCIVEENQELQKQIAQQNRPLVEMFITLVTIFAVCWFPVHVNHMLIAFDFETYLCLPTAVPLVFYLLAHANAAFNPLLYFIFINGFRKELTSKARGVWRWATSRDENATLSTWLSNFRSRSPSIRRRRRSFVHRDDNPTADKDIDPTPPTPPTPVPFIKTLDLDIAYSTNHGLSLETNAKNDNITSALYDEPRDLSHQSTERDSALERYLRIEKKDWSRDDGDRHHKPIRQSRSVNASSYVNRAYDNGNNNNLAKSMSLPWKLSTFV